jgi:uncharacterized protein (DUF983 family)
MQKKQFPIEVVCPWCGSGRTFADKTADIKVSCRCHECGKYYHIDFNSRRAVKAKANMKTK